MKLSVIIPSYKDPSLLKTIHSFLKTSELDSNKEIVVVFDGYRPLFDLPELANLHYVFLGKNRGMRGAINAGIAVSRGEYVMKVDEHCNFAQGFDRALVENCPDHGLITAARYALNPITWENLEGHPTLYEKLIIHEGRFVGVRWRRRDQKRKDLALDENMAMQGSCYLMRRDWWDKIGILQEEGYGPFSQETAEVLFKTWENDGVLLTNKLTWYSHKHRSFRRTHKLQNKHSGGNAYALAMWQRYYEEVIAPRWSG